MSETVRLTAADIDRSVRQLYAKNGYVLLSGVRNGTGYERSVRTADMIAASTWPSRGLFVEGFEIKVSRSDLVKELQTPEKADELAKYCTRWWLAVPDGLINEAMLIPPTWGIITVDKNLKAKVSKQAMQMSPTPMDALLVSAILRNFAENMVPMAEVQPKIQAAREQAIKDAEANRGYRLKQFEEAFQAFKEHSGVDLLKENGSPSWDTASIGDAVKFVRALRYRPIEDLKAAQETLNASIGALSSLLNSPVRDDLGSRSVGEATGL